MPIKGLRKFTGPRRKSREWENLKLVHPEDRELIEERRLRRQFRVRNCLRNTIPGSSPGAEEPSGSAAAIPLIELPGTTGRSGKYGGYHPEETDGRIASRSPEKELRHLSFQLLAAQENERKWIAQELHDSIGQTLVAVKFALERKISQSGTGKAPPGISMEDILAMVQSGVEETRRIMTNLRPSMLDDLGILATINWFCREFQRVYPHLELHRDIEVEEKEVPSQLKIVIFRILQEGMNNVAKHSRAKAVFLSLDKTPQTIELEIRDNGLGFSSRPLPGVWA